MKLHSPVRSLSLAFCLLALCWFVAPVNGWRVQGQSGNPVATVSAASFAPVVAPDSIAAIFGVGLATRTESAATLPLPAQLAGTTVTIGGQPAPLFVVTPGQINCLIPAGLTPGRQPIIVRSGDGVTSQGEAQVSQAAPGIFTADSSGRGRPAAVLLRVRGNSQKYDVIEETGIDLGPESEQVYLVLFLTGLRRAANNARVLIGNNNSVPPFAGAVGDGLDQVNTLIPRSLSGRGRVNVSVAVPGLALSNEVQIDIAGSSAPQNIGFETAEASAGEPMVITGSNFNPERTKNTVRIGGVEAIVLDPPSSTRLRVSVPYGVESSQVSVINARSETDRSE